MLGEQALPYVPPLRLSLEPAGSLLEQLFQAVCFCSLCPLAKRDGGHVILSVLRRAVSILHSARLLRFGFLQASCVRSLAGLLPSALSLRAGESPWETSLAQAGRMVCPLALSWGRGGIVSPLCRLEIGDRKLPPLRKVGSISPL